MSTKLKHWIRFHLLRLAQPVLEQISHYAFRIGNTEPEVTGEFYEFVRTVLKPGDIFVSREDGKPINVLIPGFWSHVALWAYDQKGRPKVIEAVGVGVRPQHLSQWILQKDHVLVLRDENYTDELGEEVAEEAVNTIGAPYDYDLLSGNKAWYCAEIGWFFWDKVKAIHGIVNRFVPRETFGVLTVSPQDFASAAKDGKFKVIALFGGEKDKNGNPVLVAPSYDA